MRELRTAVLATVLLTAVLGLLYPLAMTGAAQVAFGDEADGSLVSEDGRVVGSRLIGQDVSKDPRLFQSRPSATGYAPSATAFNNQGPNQAELADQLRKAMAAYLKREGPYSPGLTVEGIPADAVTTSASGVDPHISEDDARIQARRVARLSGLALPEVLGLVRDHTDRPLFGLAGERSVNVLELNLALRGEAR